MVLHRRLGMVLHRRLGIFTPTPGYGFTPTPGYGFTPKLKLKLSHATGTAADGMDDVPPTARPCAQISAEMWGRSQFEADRRR